MGAGGSYPQATTDPEEEVTEEKGGTRKLKWADCDDKEEEEDHRDAVRKSVEMMQKEKVEQARTDPGEEGWKRKVIWLDGSERRAQEAREEKRGADEAREEKKRANEAREEKRRAQEAPEPRRSEREVSAQEERTEQEREVEAQGGQEEDVNSVHDECHVTNRHVTWWHNAWWIRVDNGPHMRSARGRRRTWRAARQAAEQVRDGNWVGETRVGRERETEKGRKG